jgi:hypothetical protein
MAYVDLNQYAAWPSTYELGLDLPLLFLGYLVDHTDPGVQRFEPLEGSRIIRLFHTTSGRACEHALCIGQILKPHADLRPKIAALDDLYYESQLGEDLGPTSKQEDHYRRMLKEIVRSGITCSDSSISLLREGLYPIDVECVPLLASPSQVVHFPFRLADSYEKRLLLLGNNCD